MKLARVRCWVVEKHYPGEHAVDKLYITYPESSSGHALITCLECGQIIAVDVAKELYIGPPFSVKVKTVSCPQCGRSLDETYANYPEKYRRKNGCVAVFERPDLIPEDSMSIVEEFPTLNE